MLNQQIDLRKIYGEMECVQYMLSGFFIFSEVTVITLINSDNEMLIKLKPQEMKFSTRINLVGL